MDASRANNAQSLETVRPLNLYRHAVRLPSEKRRSYLVQSEAVNSGLNLGTPNQFESELEYEPGTWTAGTRNLSRSEL